MQQATPDRSSLYQTEMDKFEPLIRCESARWGSLRQDSSPPKTTPYMKSDPSYLPTDSTKGDWTRTTTYVLEEWLPTRRSSYFSHFASANLFVDITPSTLPNGTKDVAYSQTLTATGGTPPHAFTLVSGSLPAGLNLLGSTLSGTPTTAGTNTFQIGVSSADGISGMRQFTLTTEP